MRPLTLLTLAVAGLTVALLVGPGCTAVTNTTAVQCTSEAECLAKGPAFAGSTCDPTTKTCVQLPVNVGLCATNQDCLDRANGAPSICRKSDKKCVALTTPECPTVLGKQGNVSIMNDDAIIIGAMTPAGTVELGTVMEDAVSLAQSEIESGFLKGLPPVPGSSNPRPMVIVACREFSGGLDGLIRGANHLVNDLQVPLVIGPVDPSNAGIAASQVFLPNKVLNILPTAVISGLVNLPNPIAPTPLIWRLNFDDVAVATVVNQFVGAQLEPKVLAKTPAAPVKIALIAEGTQLGLSSGAQMTKVLTFNGKSAAANAVDGNFISLNYGDLNDTVGNPNPEGKISQALASLVQFKPSIILHAYATFGIQRILFGIEKAWPMDGTPRPYHVGLTPPFNTFTPMFSFLDAMPFRTGRMFAAQNFTDTTGASPPYPIASAEVQAWLSRFDDKFPDFVSSQTPKNQLVWTLYDATYLAGYAIAALQGKPVTGQNLATTLPLFNPPGQLVTTYTTDDLSKGFTELTAGRGIDIQGLSGNMNFNLAVAAPTYGLEVTCPNEVNGATVGFKGSGFHYKTDTQQAVITAPDGVTLEAPTAALNGCPASPP